MVERLSSQLPTFKGPQRIVNSASLPRQVVVGDPFGRCVLYSSACAEGSGRISIKKEQTLQISWPALRGFVHRGALLRAQETRGQDTLEGLWSWGLAAKDLQPCRGRGPAGIGPRMRGANIQKQPEATGHTEGPNGGTQLDGWICSRLLMNKNLFGSPDPGDYSVSSSTPTKNT